MRWRDLEFSVIAKQPLTGLAERPLRLFVLGATGRTGLPFVAQALARGHLVTALVRRESRVPDHIRAHPCLSLLVGDIRDSKVIASGWGEQPPDVVVTMLSSENAPHTAVSNGTRGVLEALRASRPSAASRVDRPTPLISLASWGLGPTSPYIRGLAARMLVGLAKRTFWAKPFADFERQLADIDAAHADGLVKPTIILPPILTNGTKSRTYLSGDAHAMKDLMRVTSFVARASIADLALKLGEKAASGEKTPAWVAIRDCRRGRVRWTPIP